MRAAAGRWFRRINSLDLFEALLAYVRTAVEAPARRCPRS